MKMKNLAPTFASMKAWIIAGWLLCAVFAKAEEYEVFSENGKMGIKNGQGQVVIPASFEALGWSDGSFSVIGNVTGYRSNNYWGVLNLKKEFITKADYESLVYAGADNIIARKKINPAQTKTGCINLKGEIKIPFQYDGISIHGLRAVVFTLSNGKYHFGLTDLSNNILIPIQYRNIYSLGTLRYAVENDQKKIALFSEEGKPVTDFEIDSISQFHHSKAIVYENLKEGVIDRDGWMKLKPIYRSVLLENDDQVKVQAPHEWFFINEKNEIINQVNADELKPISTKLFRIGQSGKYGLIDSELKSMCPIRYNQLEPVGNDLFVVRDGRKAGLIKADNSLVIPFQYDSLFYEGGLLRAYQKIEGWSLIDLKNQPVSQKHYDWLGQRVNNLFPVVNNHYWGALDLNGKEVIHCIYDSILQIKRDRLVVKFKNLYGVINHNEDWFVAPQPIPMELINEKVYLQRDTLNQFIKNFPNNILYFTSNKLDFKDDYFLESLPDGTEKKIDYQGILLSRTTPPLDITIERIFSSSEGLHGFKRDGKFGFIDERGRIRIANRYDDIGEFHEGLAAFKLIGKWGFLNTSDQIIIHPNYDQPSYFVNGLAIVSRNNIWGVIDRKGIPVLNLQYDSISRLPNQKFRLFSKGLIGLADEKGVILIDPRFQYLEEIGNELVIVSSAGKYGVLTVRGMNVIPMIYDELTYDKERKQFVAMKKSEWKEITLK